ncbi:MULTISPECIES: BMP family protein [Nocardiaceae]|jgi:basic membrane protein A|uniref:BMP family protein n=1 Tax=Nocardiaceae TaxID=85025 RepID=UPI0005626950|nr:MULTISPECIES: BMP family protein [Rhodococcus]OZE99936.1 BMP family ABC transporter substrate-binding protein [Rhodococcus sp. 15-1189-1-1a]OZF12514.1 BMP family ABC transporter substrate-binding protein [Rhodococcus sp. 14-2686-1-2]
MKRTLALVAVAATTLTLGACSSDDSSSSGDTLSVGVFFPGSISDTGFMESGYLGYQRILDAYGDKVDASYVEQVAAPDYQQALQRFASENDLVISVGGQTDADVRKVAPQFPDVKFVEIGGPADAEPLDNLAYYDPQQAEAEFLSGAVAASVSTTGAVAFVGGVELPAIVNAAASFEEGAKFTRPDIRVLSPQYVGDFNDPAKAKQAASAEFAGGADVLGQIVNLGKQGLQQAARESGARLSGGPIPGDCSDPAYVGYVRTDIGTEIEYAVSSALDGTWAAEQVPFGLTSDKGGTDYLLCGTDDAATLALENAKAALTDGTAGSQ